VFAGAPSNHGHGSVRPARARPPRVGAAAATSSCATRRREWWPAGDATRIAFLVSILGLHGNTSAAARRRAKRGTGSDTERRRPPPPQAPPPRAPTRPSRQSVVRGFVDQTNHHNLAVRTAEHAVAQPVAPAIAGMKFWQRLTQNAPLFIIVDRPCQPRNDTTTLAMPVGRTTPHSLVLRFQRLTWKPRQRSGHRTRERPRTVLSRLTTPEPRPVWSNDPPVVTLRPQQCPGLPHPKEGRQIAARCSWPQRPRFSTPRPGWDKALSLFVCWGPLVEFRLPGRKAPSGGVGEPSVGGGEFRANRKEARFL